MRWWVMAAVAFGSCVLGAGRATARSKDWAVIEWNTLVEIEPDWGGWRWRPPPLPGPPPTQDQIARWRVEAANDATACAEDAEALYGLGLWFLGRGEEGAGAVCLARLARECPTSSHAGDAHLVVADWSLEHEFFDAARKSYERALDDPMAVRFTDALFGLAWAELATKHLEAAVVTAHLVVQRYEGSAMPWARHARREMARVIGAAVALLVESVLYPSELVDSAALARQALSRVGDAEAEALGMEVWTTLCLWRGQCRAESLRTALTPDESDHLPAVLATIAKRALRPPQPGRFEVDPGPAIRAVREVIAPDSPWADARADRPNLLAAARAARSEASFSLGVWLGRKARGYRTFNRIDDLALYRDAIVADLDSLAEYPAFDGPWTPSALAHIETCVAGIVAVLVPWHRPR
jgi:hypothetical protein